MRLNKASKYLYTALILCHCALSLASDSQPRPPIEVEADRVDMDAKSGISIYQGNAVMTHGEMRISGDRIEIHTTEEGELKHLIVIGQPARYRDLPEGEEQEVRAKASRMEYYVSGPERALFFGDALFWQGQDSLSGDSVFVNLETQAVKAQGNDDQRARAIIYPGQREER
ncbi:LptA [Halorhodospira halochloris]|uniref:Lipopolysaccharide export system protein LptA n=1 Tax=Halorhodospira halochloris TaxID=1052 RepID=A0A0X8XAL4_HALHR|nr:lipopolysaccharide transport periplasmic protein LptA [Halorhodospira halochloris]MBK1651681.1 lipopolysaccharide transport periplasmic protein LptA [Halorhodospira halochloris]BAU58545.2 LptA [Halorhodospira halochloris]